MDWWHWALPFAVSFIIVLSATPLIRTYALRWSIGDKPNGRKIQTYAVPHLGGVGISLGVLGGAALYGYLAGWGMIGPGVSFVKILPAAILIILIGLIDDTKNLKALQKLTVQTIAAIILASFGLQLIIGVPAVDGTIILAGLLTVVFLVGISNSLNLIDGHDGLASGIGLIASSALVILSVILDVPAAIVVSLSVAGASLAFLVYNFPPGKIFMGDTGSMFLGIMLATVSCSLTMAEPSPYTFFAVCFILGVPILDTWLAIARRLLLNVPLFKADFLHVHHVLSSFGFSSKQTLLILWLLETVLAVLGVFTVKGYLLPIFFGLFILALAFFSFLKAMISSVKSEETLPAKLAHSSVPSLEK